MDSPGGQNGCALLFKKKSCTVKFRNKFILDQSAALRSIEHVQVKPRRAVVGVSDPIRTTECFVYQTNYIKLDT